VRNFVSLASVVRLALRSRCQLGFVISCAVDFGCRSIARLRFAYSDCAFILILVSNPVLRANSFLIAIRS
jgi:hypothetical protein